MTDDRTTTARDQGAPPDAGRHGQARAGGPDEHDRERMRDQNLRNATLPDDGNGLGPDHDMGGDIGPASIRGSGVSPGSSRDGDAGPRTGYAEPMGYMAGRDDEWPETAGSDEKAVGARADEIEPHVETAGPSPHPMPPDPPDAGAGRHAQRPGFRVPGPADEQHEGEVDDVAPASPGDTADPPPEMPATAGHVTATEDWVPDDEDDPDAGSGRTGG